MASTHSFDQRQSTNFRKAFEAIKLSNYSLVGCRERLGILKDSEGEGLSGNALCW